MKRKRAVKTGLLLLMALLVAGAGLFSYSRGTNEKLPEYDRLLLAAEKTKECMEAVKKERLSRGIAIDASEDYFETGLLGSSYSAITTTLGSLPSKRTSANPDMGALCLRLLLEAGVQAGDKVGVSCSGSFPALNIAACCACNALGAEPLIIASVGASTYGANLTEFTGPEMLKLLLDKGLIQGELLAVTPGGDGDLGLNMAAAYFEEEKPALQEALSRMAKAGITVTYIEDEEENLRWRLSLYGEIDCFINVGGGVISLGSSGEGYALGEGLITKGSAGTNSLLGVYLNRGTPVIELLNVKSLCASYGLAFDPIALAPLGTSGVYCKKVYPKAPLIAAFALVAALALLYGRIDKWKLKKDRSGGDLCS